MASFVFTTSPLVDGDVASAASIQDQLDDLAAHLANASAIDNAALAKPEHLVVIGPFCPGNAAGTLIGGVATVWQYAYKPTVRLIPVRVDLFFAADSAGTLATLSLDVKKNGTSILNAVLTCGTPDSIVSTASFADPSINSGSTVTFHIQNTAATGNDAQYVSFSMTCKAEHIT
tara:strand:- start:786 stop:1307 length:522 start_codon:yes stop_codon:yes gene_type:complete